MKKRYNNLPKAVLGFKTPNEIELNKLIELMEDTGNKMSIMSHIN